MGGKKHKKTFTTPKKNHHEKNKEPLAVLKLYKVDDESGTLEKLRKECPSPQCGPGSFMASHSDRLTCGKCGLTLVPDSDSNSNSNSQQILESPSVNSNRSSL